ncbi:MAG: hypothetical protein D8M28_00660 [Proteobacteria bacterium]|nr:hypothetical protein [Pseudomonadota bacterium]
MVLYAFRPYYLLWIVTGFRDRGLYNEVKYNSGFLARTAWKLVILISVIGIAFVMFSGVDRLLSWIPDDWGSIGEDGFTSHRLSFAGFSGVGLTFLLLGFLVSMLEARVKMHKLATLASGYEEIIEAIQLNKFFQLAHLEKKYKDQAEKLRTKHANLLDEREYFIKQARVYDHLSRYAADVCNQLKTEKADVRNDLKETERSAADCTESNRLIESTKAQMTADWHKFRKKHLLPIEKVNKDASISQKHNTLFALDDTLFYSTWNRTHKLLKSHIIVTDDEIAKGKSRQKTLRPLIKDMKTISLKSGWNIFYKYSGDSHGGKCDFFAKAKDGTQEPIWKAIKHETNSAQGLIELFCLILELPKSGVYWHGLYGLDYEFILTDEQLLFNVLRDKEYRKPFDPSLHSVMAVPTGLRIEIRGNGSIHTNISCIAYQTNEGLIDYSLEYGNDLDDLSISKNPLLKTSSQVFY